MSSFPGAFVERQQYRYDDLHIEVNSLKRPSEKKVALVNTTTAKPVAFRA